MTFKDLQKLVQSNAGPLSNLDQGIKKLQDKPFWIWDKDQHGLEYRRTKGHRDLQKLIHRIRSYN